MTDASDTILRLQVGEFMAMARANMRGHADYFTWKSDRTLEEWSVVRIFRDSLDRDGRGFFHSFTHRGCGKDPPDCEALSNAGERIAIELTEFVDQDSIRAAKAREPLESEPLTRTEVYRRLSDLIARKDNPHKVKGGPYQIYIVLVYSDDPLIRDYDIIEYVRNCEFPATRLINRAFLMLSYNPWEKCHPCIELNLGSDLVQV